MDELQVFGPAVFRLSVFVVGLLWALSALLAKRARGRRLAAQEEKNRLHQERERDRQATERRRPSEKEAAERLAAKVREVRPANSSTPETKPTSTRTGQRRMTERRLTTLPYRRVELQQGSKEWHAWRRNGIGASDAPAIMGENRFKSRSSLLNEKISNRRVRLNDKMKEGTALEPEARKSFESELEVDVPAVCLESTKYAWLKASLDGLSLDGTVAVEIKCGESSYEYVKKHGTVPRYYYGQLQHILAITGLPIIHFWNYRPRRKPVRLEIKRNNEYISRLRAMEEAFWSELSGSL